LVGIAIAGNAQKFAMVDMEYILRNSGIRKANEQLTQISKKWQSEWKRRFRNTEFVQKLPD
jgi:outer membrane protein